jgi:hypothetical protein
MPRFLSNPRNASKVILFLLVRNNVLWEGRGCATWLRCMAGQVDAADVLACGVARARLRLFEATSLTAHFAFPLHPWAHPTAEAPSGPQAKLYNSVVSPQDSAFGCVNLCPAPHVTTDACRKYGTLPDG